MSETRSSILPLTASAIVAVVPALAASYFAPSVWTIGAAAGSAVGATALVVIGSSASKKVATVEVRERHLQREAATLETRIAALEAKARESATYDDVTTTYNRRTFLTRLDEALRRDARLEKPMAFLLVDVDGFKRINAEGGRMIGDRVLRAVGKAIQASTRGTDFVGRIGGDEFGVVLGECLDPRPAIDRIFVALDGEPNGLEPSSPVKVSIGTVTIDPRHTRVDPVNLFRLAEEALNSVRTAEGGRYGKREYTPEPHRPVAKAEVS